MRKLFQLILLTTSVFSYSQIDVDPASASESTMTPEQLVNNVLLTNCATVNWVGEQVHTIGSSKTYGYFTNNGTAFPVNSGIVLSTGYVETLEGPNGTLVAPGAQTPVGGDADLETLCNVNFPGIDVPTLNATYFEFELIPQVNNLSFSYVFGSEEYERFDTALTDDGKECFTATNQGLQDSFAILVSGPGITPDPEFAGNPPNTQWRNITKVPTTTLPVSVGTIHNNPTCSNNPSSNSALYNTVPVGGGDVSVNGITDVLTSTVAVTSGSTYRIKMVIGDRGDNQGDSAVFLLGGTIGLDVDLGSDLTLCATSHTLDAGPGGTSYNWTGPNGFTGNTQTVNVTDSGTYNVTVNGSGSCQDSDSIDITFIGQPGASRVDQALSVCDDTFGTPVDGLGLFDITQFESTILGHPLNTGVPTANLQVVYYATEADAIADINPIANPTAYVNTISNPQRIFYRVRNILAPACLSNYVSADHNFEIGVVATPQIATVNNFNVCDPDNDGTVTLDLSAQVTEAIGTNNPAEVAVTFFASEADLIANVNPLGNTPTITGSPTPIWVRLSNSSRVECNTYGSFEVTILNSPQIQSLPDFTLCDDTASGSNIDGLSTFDLTTYNNTVMNGQATVFTPTYYTSTNGANIADGTDQIMNPSAFINTIPSNQTIYVRLEDSVNGCYNIAPINLVVTAVPVLNATTLVQCEIDATIDGLTVFNLTEANANVITTGTEADYLFTYHATQVDADTATNGLANTYSNTTPNQIIFVRVQHTTTSCYNVAQVTLSAVSNPVPAAILNSCDTDGSGTEDFVLSTANSQILPSVPAGATIAYFASQSDAQQEQNQLQNNYTSTSANQVIYYRVENTNNCYGIGTLQLNANPLPLNNLAVSPYNLCSDNGTTATFDLTTTVAGILNGQTGMNVTFFPDAAAAQSGLSPLATNYQNDTNPDILHVRIENTTTGCFVTGTTLTLNVNQNPTIQSGLEMAVCDLSNPGDGIEDFDLTQMNATYIGGNPDLAVNYYPTLLDAQGATNQLTLPYTSSGSSDQVFVRLEDTTTGCFSTAVLNLRVNVLPTANTPTPLVACDNGANNDGFYEDFDLPSKDNEITGGNPNLVVSYHETMTNAENNALALSSPHTNFDPYNDDVFARVEDTTTGCYTVITLQLVVNDSPVPPMALDPLVICDDDIDGTNTTFFDLTIMYNDILGNQSLTDFPVHFYLTAAHAAADNPRIVNPSNFAGSNGQEIFYNIISNANGCVTTGSFFLQVDALPTISDVEQLDICDNATPFNDGTGIFDLTTSEDAITIGNSSLIVDFYQTLGNALSQITDIPDYMNFTGTDAQTLFVVVTDPTTACTSMGTLTLHVLNVPQPQTNLPIMQSCSGDSPTATFDLVTYGIDNLGLNATETVVYLDGSGNEISNPAAYTNSTNPETITAVVSNQNIPTGATEACSTEVTFEIEVPLPFVIAPDDLFICEDGNGGYIPETISATTTVDVSTGRIMILSGPLMG